MAKFERKIEILRQKFAANLADRKTPRQVYNITELQLLMNIHVYSVFLGKKHFNVL